jgi:hypothetical protein
MASPMFIMHSSVLLAFIAVLACVSAWNKDPVIGVIGIQKGPR